MKKTLITLSVISNLFLSISAFAEAQQAALLACDEQSSKFIVRFGLFEDEEYMPLTTVLPEIKKNWESYNLRLSGSCDLNNGKKITVSYNSGLISNGAGGGNPSAFFSLKINDINVYHEKEFFEGYNIQGHYNLNTINYDGNKLQECSGKGQVVVELPPELIIKGQPDGKINPSLITCTDVTERLKGQDFQKRVEKLKRKK